MFETQVGDRLGRYEGELCKSETAAGERISSDKLGIDQKVLRS